MKLLVDFFPVVVFFVVYKAYDIYAATYAIVVAMCLSICFQWFRHKSIDKMQWVTLILVVVLGGATVLFKNPVFIKWKPTVVNWLFAGAFLLTPLFSHQSLLRTILPNDIVLPKFVWQRLNFMWIVFFMVMGGVNLYVAYSFSEDFWVNFKVFGMLGLTFLFILLQGFYLYRYMPQDGVGSISPPKDRQDS